MDRELAASNRGRPRWDSLEVSLHDVDLAHEVELLAYLMVAANETEHRLAQHDVDRILGVSTNGGADAASGLDAAPAPAFDPVPALDRADSPSAWGNGRVPFQRRSVD